MKMSENMYNKMYMDNNVPYNNEKYLHTKLCINEMSNVHVHTISTWSRYLLLNFE